MDDVSDIPSSAFSVTRKFSTHFVVTACSPRAVLAAPLPDDDPPESFRCEHDFLDEDIVLETPDMDCRSDSGDEDQAYLPALLDEPDDPNSGRMAPPDDRLVAQIEKNAELQAEVEVLRAQLRRARVDAGKTVLGSLDLKVMRKELEQKDERIRELETAVQNLQEQSRGKEVKSDEGEVIENLKRRLQNSEEEVEDLKSALLNADKMGEALRKAREECLMLAARLSESERRVEDLIPFRTLAAEAEAELRRLRSEPPTTPETTPELSKLELELQRLRDENALLRNELKSARRSVRPPDQATILRTSRIPTFITRKMSRISEMDDSSTKSDDDVIPLRTHATPLRPLTASTTDHRPAPASPAPPPMTPEEMELRIQRLTAERTDLEQQLKKALPKEKGPALTRIQHERDEMELRMVQISKEISKLKLNLHWRSKQNG
jgi:hypothetical protein